MEEELKAIFEKYEYDPANGYDSQERVINSDDFDNIIGEIVKLCNLQNVIKSVCKHDDMERISENYFQCVECGEIKGFGQTDL